MESIVTVDASYLFDDEDESAPQLPATTSVPTLSTPTPTPRVAGAASKNKENAQEHGELDADLRNRAKSKAIRNRHRVRKSSPLANVDNMDVDEPLTPALAKITNATSLNDAVITVKTINELSCSGPACTSRSRTARTSPVSTDARLIFSHRTDDMSSATTSLDDVLPAAIEPALHEEAVDDVADSQPLDSNDTIASDEYPVEGLIESDILSTNSQPDGSDDIPHVDFLDEKIFGRMNDLPPRCSTPEPDQDLPFDPSLRLDIEQVPERRPTQKKHTDKQFHKLPLRLQLAEHIVEQKLWDEYERALEEHKRVKRLALAFRLQQEMQMLEEEDDDDDESCDGDALEEEEDISGLLHKAMEDSHGATVDASLGVSELSAESPPATSTSMTLDTVVAQILNDPTLTATSIPPASSIDIADLFLSEVNDSGATTQTTPTVTSIPDGMDPTSLPAPAMGSQDDMEYNAEADTTFDSITYSATEDGDSDIYADSDDSDDDDEQTLYSDTDSDSESTLMILPVRPSSSRHTTIPKERLLWDAYARVLLSAHRLCRRKGNWDCEDRHYEYRDVPDPEFNRYNVVIEDAKNEAWSLRAYGPTQ